MTREEALKNTKEFPNKTAALKMVPLADVDILIEDIFDYFESRNCDNCRFYVYYSDSETSCHHNEIAIYYPEKTFGCNKFEQK